MASRAPLGVLIFLTAIVYSTAGLFDSCSCEGTLQKIQVQIQNLQTTIDKQSIIQDVSSGYLKLAYEKLLAMSEFEKHIPSIVHEIYGRTKSNFALLLDWSNQSEESVRQGILISLHREMKTLKHHDSDKFIILVEQFQKNVNQKEITREVIFELGQQIKKKTAELLIQGLRSYGNINKTEIRVLAETLQAYYPTTFYDLLMDLANAVKGANEAQKVLEYLFRQTKRSPQFTNAMIDFYLKVSKNGRLSDKFQVKISSILSKIRDRSEHPIEDTVEEMMIERSIKIRLKTLPICIKNLFFTSHVCLWNKDHDAFLEASPRLYNDQRRLIDIRSSNNNTSKAAQWIVHEMDDKIFFENIAYKNEYLYVSNIKPKNSLLTKYVFTWVPGNNTGNQSGFYVEIQDEYCYLKSSHFYEYLFVANSTQELLTDIMMKLVLEVLVADKRVLNEITS